MIVSNILEVTILCILLFALPVVVTLVKYVKERAFNITLFYQMVKAFNMAFIVQTVIGLLLVAYFFVFLVENFKNFSELEEIIYETIYTYVGVGLLMYLPCLFVLNLVKWGIKAGEKK